MNKGDIVLVRFPFTDLTTEKLRPALVIAPDNSTGDVILVFITAQIDKEEIYDVLITSKDPNFSKTGLKKDSIIKTNKLATLNKRIIIGKIGTSSAKTITEVNKSLRKILDL